MHLVQGAPMATAKKTSTAKKSSAEPATPVAATKRAPRKKAAETTLPESVATPVAEPPKVVKAAKPGKTQTTLSASAPWPFPTYSKP